MHRLNVKRYDSAHMAELLKRESDLVRARSEVADRMHDRARGSDKTWSDSEVKAHSLDTMTLQGHDSALAEVRKGIEAMNIARKPDPKKNDAPFLRWMRGKDITADDRRTFCSAENSANPAGPTMDRFTLPYDIDGYEYATGNRARPHMAALAGSTTADTSAGFVVPDEQSELGRIVEELKFVGGALAACYNFFTANGDPMPVPSLDDTANEGEVRSAEDTTTGAQSLPAFSRVVFNAYTASSKMFYLTNELIQDVSFDIQGYVERQAWRRIGKAMNKAITQGDHDDNPQGLIATADEAFTTATTLKITWPEFTNLIYAVPRAYRFGSEGFGDGMSAVGGGMIGYMWADGVEQLARLLSDSQNRPLWLPSVREGVPATFNGVPAIVNGHMEAVGVNKHSCAYGNFSYYGIRRVGAGDTFYRIQDTTTLANNATAFIAFRRFDGRYRLPKDSSSNDVQVVAKIKGK